MPTKTKTRRPPSAAQIKEREERLEALHEDLVAKTHALTSSAGWIEFLEFASKFRQYSFNNTLLILIQCPEATRVASYKQWTELGRHAIKGTKALQIFAPLLRKREDEKTGEERKALVGFRLVPVFDVSQTEGDPLPEDLSRPTLLEGEAPEGLYDSLAGMVAAAGYTLRVGPSEHGENGYTRPSDKVVQVTEGLSAAQSCKTLIHEVAHMLLHTDDKVLTQDALLHRNVAEVEAESVAYIVANVHGLPTEDYSIPYVAGWSDGKTATIAATADRVLKTTKQILATTDAEEVAV